MNKSGDGAQWKRRGDTKVIVYFWKIGRNKSKEFTDKIACANDYVKHYVQHYPKYKDVISGKNQDEIFRIFEI